MQQVSEDSRALPSEHAALPRLRWYAATKRALDFTFALIGLIVLSPFLLLIAILVKLSSRGPVLYRGVRTGRFGVPIKIFKFRTMVANAESIGGTSTAETDPRITTIGRWLRKHKLDEFPQLLNVLKGDMSFVGPRPEVEEYTRLYTQEERAILAAVPGITDLSSVRFRHLNTILAASGDPDKYFAEHVLPIKNQLRLQYVRNRSLGLDFAIVFRTLRALWTH